MKTKVLILFFVLLSTEYLSAQNLSQNIRGKIFDKVTNQPLEGATISLKNTKLNAVSDSKGVFRIEKVPFGRYSLTISFTGYQTLQIPDLVVNTAKETVLEIGINEQINTLDEVTVQPNNSLTINPVSSKTFTIEETQRFAATFYDPARLVASYPGVSTTNDQANNISIRGNSPNAMAWRLEGVEIVNPNHLTNAGTQTDKPMQNGGGTIILSSQLMANSQFLTGAFAPQFGNSVGGIFDINLRKGNNEKQEFTAQASLLGFDLSTEGQFGKSSSASYLVNYRYSFTGLLGAMGVSFGGEKIGFQDLSFNLNFPTKKGRIGIFGMGGKSSNIFKSPDPKEWVESKERYNISFDNQMGAIGLVYETTLGKKTAWRSSIAFSGKDALRQSSINPLSDYQPEFPRVNDILRESKLSINTNFNHKLSKKVSLTEGLYVVQSNSTLGTNNFITDKVIIPNTKNLLLQFYSNLKTQLGDNLVFNLGLQGNSFNYQTNFESATATKQTLEPRLSLVWNPSSSNAFTLAYGSHSQTPLIGTVYNILNWDVSRANHYVLSYNQTISQHIRLKTEVYYQDIFNAPTTQIGSFSGLNLLEGTVSETILSKGTGKNMGVEVSLEQFLAKKFYYLASLSLFDSKYKGSDGIERNTRFNNQYVFNFTGGKEVAWNKKNKNRTVGFNTRLIYQGGYFDTPINEFGSLKLRRTIYRENEAFSKKLPDYFRLDLRISIKKQKAKYTRTLALDIQNATSQENVVYSYFDDVANKVLEKKQLGLIPNLSWRLEF